MSVSNPNILKGSISLAIFNPAITLSSLLNNKGINSVNTNVFKKEPLTVSPQWAIISLNFL